MVEEDTFPGDEPARPSTTLRPGRPTIYQAAFLKVAQIFASLHTLSRCTNVAGLITAASQKGGSMKRYLEVLDVDDVVICWRWP
jgi:hypothetical protein